MAKVRIQARAGGAEASEGDCLPGDRSKVKRQPGALGLLLRVLRKEGFSGWYQVSITALSLLIQSNSYPSGDVRTDHQSRTFSGVIVRIQGAVRALGPDVHGFVRQDHCAIMMLDTVVGLVVIVAVVDSLKKCYTPFVHLSPECLNG